MTKRKQKSPLSLIIWLTVIVLVAMNGLFAWLMRGKDIMVLNPKGPIASQQKNLLITATLLLLEIAIPTLLYLYFTAWKYRESNTKTTFDPDAGRGRRVVAFMWAFPLITFVLMVTLLIPATQKLEPQKAIAATNKPITIEVVALRWKWLFIYPEQRVATVNYVQVPIDTPIQFLLTADETPMSSFWIPHLGGQLYAMTGHVNQLNLMAHSLGDFEGSVAEINGRGFAGMRFNTRVSNQADFDSWVTATQDAPEQLDAFTYAQLLKPTENNKPVYFSNPDVYLYSNIVNKNAGGHPHQNYTGQE